MQSLIFFSLQDIGLYLERNGSGDLERAFQVLDKDGDGLVSASDLLDGLFNDAIRVMVSTWGITQHRLVVLLFIPFSV